MMLSPQYRRALVLVAAFGLAVMAAGVARAFTVEDKGGSGSGQGFTDLDIPKASSAGAPDSRFKSKDGMTSYKTDFGTVQFGSQPSFNQRYNPNSLFDPFARDGR
ncbi:MAG TPA: hypothetical protein VG986_07075 [Pseudolabrys sp.]|nr:hypothetical protein [Pseudolabrys sp.]